MGQLFSGMGAGSAGAGAAAGAGSALGAAGQAALQGLQQAGTSTLGGLQSFLQGLQGGTAQGSMSELGRAGLTPAAAGNLGIQVLGPGQAAPAAGGFGMNLGQMFNGLGQGLMGQQGIAGGTPWMQGGNMLGQLMQQSPGMTGPQAYGQMLNRFRAQSVPQAPAAGQQNQSQQGIGGIMNSLAGSNPMFQSQLGTAKQMSDKGQVDTLNTILTIASLFLGGG